MLELFDIHKSYREGGGRREVLRGASARFEAGQFVAIVGRSGSGKSTLLNVVSGIDRPDSGEVVLDGYHLSGRSERQRTLLRRSRIGFVFQFFNLIPTLTVEENLRLPLELNRLGAEASDRIGELLDRVGLADRLKSYPDQLSGGEQQRVALVRALVHQPGLVLADEPTGNLDDETGRRVLELLADVVRAQGRLLLLVTHSLDAAGYADRIIHIEDGRLRESSA